MTREPACLLVPSVIMESSCHHLSIIARTFCKNLLESKKSINQSSSTMQDNLSFFSLSLQFLRLELSDKIK